MFGIAAKGSERAQSLFRCKAPQHTIVRTMRMPALGRARLRSPNRVNVEVRYSFGIDFECPATVTMTIHRMRIKKEQVQPDLLGSYLLYRCIDHHYILRASDMVCLLYRSYALPFAIHSNNASLLILILFPLLNAGKPSSCTS